MHVPDRLTQYSYQKSANAKIRDKMPVTVLWLYWLQQHNALMSNYFCSCIPTVDFNCTLQQAKRIGTTSVG